MIGADTLFLLSDVNGLYTADPRNDPGAEHLPWLETLTPDIMAMGGGANMGEDVGSGGMATKLIAAEIALAAGCSTCIAQGEAPAPLTRLQAGETCTWIYSQLAPQKARQTWLKTHLTPQGSVRIDRGAEAALRAGNSLLPVGVTDVEGDFSRGDAIAILSADGDMIAKGMTNYAHEDARRIAGHQSQDLDAILGDWQKARATLIHRDDLIMM